MTQQRDRRSPERRAGDKYLLAAPGDGWVDVEELRRVMMPHVMPGKAHRKTHARRKPVEDEDGRKFVPTRSNQRDPLIVGQRQAANDAIKRACRGSWHRSGSMVRHRDHKPVGGFTVPGPETLEVLRRPPEAASILAVLSKLSKWGLAALVAAHVEEAEHPGPQSSRKSERTPRAFADLGIPGLGSDNTVRRYLRAWQSTGLPRPKPGDTITLPDIPFPTIKQQQPKPTDVRNPNMKRTRTTIPDRYDLDAWTRLITENCGVIPDLTTALLDYQRQQNPEWLKAVSG